MARRRIPWRRMSQRRNASSRPCIHAADRCRAAMKLRIPAGRHVRRNVRRPRVAVSERRKAEFLQERIRTKRAEPRPVPPFQEAYGLDRARNGRRAITGSAHALGNRSLRVESRLHADAGLRLEPGRTGERVCTDGFEVAQDMPVVEARFRAERLRVSAGREPIATASPASVVKTTGRRRMRNSGAVGQETFAPAVRVVATAVALALANQYRRR